MAGELTWYEVLDVLPGCSADEVQRAFEAKENVLGPTRISGAASKVVTAAGRARTAIETARDVLTDPARRQRYDDEIGLRRAGGGLTRPEPVPSRGGWTSDAFWYNRGAMIGGAALEAIGAVADWLAPSAAAPRRVEVPDLRGLFVGPCRHVVSSAGLHMELVRLTDDPMPVEGLVVDQSPRPGTKIRRSGTLTVQVWHPPRQRGRR
jgi:PASTA domain